MVTQKICLSAVVAVAVLSACKADQLQMGDDRMDHGGAGGSSSEPVDADQIIPGTGGAAAWDGSLALRSVCGDGLLEPGEQCDDGNVVSLDGCSALCQLESGYSCGEAGMPCVAAPICGDGVVASKESCDDGNTVAGDGCAADCSSIERGWSCPVPGRACRPRCGDGLVVGSETCDDGNVVSGDGCSSRCEVEPGYSCPAIGQPCLHPVCGNGKLEAGEACDCGVAPAELPSGCVASNGLLLGDGSGCTDTCTREPGCLGADGRTQACTTACGDGTLDPGEACDDGNRSDGDGCSSTCKLESGFTCTEVLVDDTATCASGSGQCLRLPVIYRDFEPENAPSRAHPDFFFLGTRYAGSTSPTTVCVPNAAGPAHGNDATKRCWGIAADALLKGKPQPGGTTTCACQFSDWSIGNASRIPGGYSAVGNDSPLSDGRGGYLGGSAGSAIRTTGWAGVSAGTMVGFTASSPGGPIFNGTVPAYQNAASFAQWFADDASVNTRFVSALEMKAIGSGLYQYASSVHLADGGFFPLDALNPSRATLCNLWPYWNHGDGTPIWPSCVGDQYYDGTRLTTADCATAASGCWVKDVTGVKHDSYFTFEARHHLLYDGATGFSLTVDGDDDLFVFINGTLVLDLGGTHQSLPGRVTITGSPGDAHVAEGGCLDSAGNLTGASAGSSACWPSNASPVGASSPDDFRVRSVPLGLQSGQIYELAIFGADRHAPESNLQLILSGNQRRRSQCVPTCGDGVVVAGEACDDGLGNADGAYGGCDTTCQLGPYCGDGVVNGPEECDLGPDNGDATLGMVGCSAACTRLHYCGDGVTDATLGESCDLGAQNGAPGSRCTSLCTWTPIL